MKPYTIYKADHTPDITAMDRRGFVQTLGAGLLFTVPGGSTLAAQSSPGVPDTQTRVHERIHIGADGRITVMTGKVELGQGARTQLTQAAAEELRVPLERIDLLMADTDLTPNDGGTSGSQTTPRTVPAVRQACAGAREALISLAAEIWQCDRSALKADGGAVFHTAADKSLTHAALAGTDGAASFFQRTINTDIMVTPVSEWRVMGTVAPKIGRADVATGAHRYPSDIERPGMLYGKALFPPSFGARLISVDTGAAAAMDGVTAVHDGSFAGVAAPSSHLADAALQTMAKTAQWETAPHPSSKILYSHLKEHASDGGGNQRGGRGQTSGSVDEGLRSANKTLQTSYEIAYIQHVPMEPRAAVAEWNGGKVTVWTGTQQPARVRDEVARSFNLPENKVRVIVPDTGGGFGGKHTGETAVQAAKLARAAQRPVSVQWTRAQEFTWAYFRPAGVIETRAGLDAGGRITAWDFNNYNSGPSAVATPYNIPHINARHTPCDSPLREGSYRTLAATANVFARESFMDELAYAAGSDPLAFRLKHLEDERLRNVLTAAAEKFDWDAQKKRITPERGFGLACGTEKGSFTAACVEVAIDRAAGVITVPRITQAFECGAIINPDNLRSQVEGCIVMGLGGALWEEIRFENGKILNAGFSHYRVPRFKDVPDMDILLLNRPDLPSVGAGETPIVAIAPAIANAVFAATGVRIRSMPLRPELLKKV